MSRRAASARPFLLRPGQIPERSIARFKDFVPSSVLDSLFHPSIVLLPSSLTAISTFLPTPPYNEDKSGIVSRYKRLTLVVPHALILVGGFGTRLRPLTVSAPSQRLNHCTAHPPPFAHHSSRGLSPLSSSATRLVPSLLPVRICSSLCFQAMM